MDLNNKLKERINIKDVKEVLEYIEKNRKGIEELYELIFDPNTNVSYQALWICSHLSNAGHQWLFKKQNVIIEELFSCTHSGKRRLLLSLLLCQPIPDPPRVDLLDFCFEHMVSKHEPPGVQVLSMKLAYNLCQSIPELLQELKVMLDIMQMELLPPSMRAVRKNILKTLSKRKTI